MKCCSNEPGTGCKTKTRVPDLLIFSPFLPPTRQTNLPRTFPTLASVLQDHPQSAAMLRFEPVQYEKEHQIKSRQVARGRGGFCRTLFTQRLRHSQQIPRHSPTAHLVCSSAVDFLLVLDLGNAFEWVDCARAVYMSHDSA